LASIGRFTVLRATAKRTVANRGKSAYTESQ